MNLVEHGWPVLERLAFATAIGGTIGLERDWSGHDAGLRTHAIVSLSSAMLTLSALMLLGDLRAQGADADPLRVIQGLAQAIGFIAGGLIFIRGSDVRNMTTAASLWMSAVVGIGSGAGQFLLVSAAAAVAVALLVVDRALGRLRSVRNPPARPSAEPLRPPSRRGSSRDT